MCRKLHLHQKYQPFYILLDADESPDSPRELKFTSTYLSLLPRLLDLASKACVDYIQLKISMSTGEGNIGTVPYIIAVKPNEQTSERCITAIKTEDA